MGACDANIIEINRRVIAQVKEDALRGSDVSLPLVVVDGRSSGWEEKAVKEANTNRNFIVILKKSDEVHRLCAVVGCTERWPEKLERWGLHAIGDALTMKDYALLLSLYQTFDLRFVEQLSLQHTRPPRTKPVLLYCEIHGIISEFNSLSEAADAFLDYIHTSALSREYPLAGLYLYQNGQWLRQHRPL